jgi:hypothetical protein
MAKKLKLKNSDVVTTISDDSGHLRILSGIYKDLITGELKYVIDGQDYSASIYESYPVQMTYGEFKQKRNKLTKFKVGDKVYLYGSRGNDTWIYYGNVVKIDFLSVTDTFPRYLVRYQIPWNGNVEIEEYFSQSEIFIDNSSTQQ